MQHSVVLILDGLQAGFLGCYGNAWVDTPAVNRLAAQGCCFDQMLVDSLSIESLYRSYWRGVHAQASAQVAGRNEPLPKLLAAAGVRQRLVSDAPDCFANDLVEPFESHLVVPLDAGEQPATGIQQTHAAEFFTAAIESLSKSKDDQSSLLWLHTQGLNGSWDAPLELREQLRDDEDLTPSESAEVPHLVLADESDPDELVRIAQAYAAQVMLFDHGLQWLLDALDRSPIADDTLLIVAGARGFALGEHGWVGTATSERTANRGRLHGELLHVPLLVRMPGRQAVAVRNGTLVQPADLYHTLAAWFGVQAGEKAECRSQKAEVRSQKAEGCGGLSGVHPALGRDLLPLVLDDLAVARRVAFAAHEEERVARTDLWQLQQTPESQRLYVKPEDRWEVNDIADRAPRIAEELAALTQQFEMACGDAEAEALKVLSEELERAPE